MDKIMTIPYQDGEECIFHPSEDSQFPQTGYLSQWKFDPEDRYDRGIIINETRLVAASSLSALTRKTS